MKVKTPLKTFWVRLATVPEKERTPVRRRPRSTEPEKLRAAPLIARVMVRMPAPLEVRTPARRRAVRRAVAPVNESAPTSRATLARLTDPVKDSAPARKYVD